MVKSITNSKNIFLLIIILLVAFWLRTLGIDWDQGQYLHPDERFLAMVINALRLPKNLFAYLDQDTSPLNPYLHNFSFFVYGHFPLTVAKMLAVISKHESYLDFRFVGRYLSALVDVSSVLAVYFLAKTILKTYPRLLPKKQAVKFPLLSALCYAVFVFPIQQAHFFTLDPFANAFFLWSLVFVLQKSVVSIFMAAVFLALGLASKLNVVLSLPLILAIFLLKKRTRLLKKILWLLFFLATVYFSLRLADPYLFEHSNLLNPTISKQYLQNLKFLKEISTGKVFYPPGVQWYSKNFTFPLFNISLFGVGLGFFLIATLGFVFLAKKIFKQKGRWLFILLNGWLLSLFIFQSLQMVKTMRYFLFVYPFIAIYAGAFLAKFDNRLLKAVLFLSGFAWTVAFLSIYLTPHTRIQASNWIYQHLPENSNIVWEYWDDPLPLNMPAQTKRFNQVVIDFYYPDTKQKWELIAKKLKHSDYIVLSSNRQWASLSQVPEFYPITSKYYRLLLSNKLGFKKIAQFTSYPSLKIAGWRLEIPDKAADEAFSVYDHPQVMIFQKQQSFSEKGFLKTLLN